MVEAILLADEAAGEILPEAFHFLHVGWWVLHLIAIPLVFIVGFVLGGRGGKGSAPAASPKP